jgi:hypothetical protein
MACRSYLKGIHKVHFITLGHSLRHNCVQCSSASVADTKICLSYFECHAIESQNYNYSCINTNAESEKCHRIPRSKVLFHKVIFAQPVNKLPAFYETRNFTTVNQSSEILGRVVSLCLLHNACTDRSSLYAAYTANMCRKQAVYMKIVKKIWQRLRPPDKWETRPLVRGRQTMTKQM